MAKSNLLYCATDKEIYDALASSAQQFSEASLLSLASRRGVFYSPLADRMQLCNDISLLGFGYNDVAQIQAEFEKSSKSEKKTFKTLDAPLTLDEFRTIAEQLQSAASEEGETVTSQNSGSDLFKLDVKYEEVDFGKTRLRQRQRREAAIELKVRNGSTIISYPSNDKIKLMVEDLIERAKKEKKEKIAVDEVDLSWISNYDLRTKFFQELIRKVPGFTLEDVTHVQVDFGDTKPADADLLEAAEEEKKAAEDEITSVVRDIALHGQALHLSDEYKRLKDKGFFLTSVQWTGRRSNSPHEKVQFEAGFDDPAAGVGFRYAVRTWKVALESGQYAKNFTSIPADDKAKLSSLLQQASMSVYLEIKTEFKKSAASADGEPL